MLAAVYRNAFGPYQVWLLPPALEDGDGEGAGQEAGQEALRTYRLPTAPDERGALVFGGKGPGLSWEEWARYLAQTPQLGDWSVEQVSDAMSAHDVLVYVRQLDAARALFDQP